MKTLLYLFVLCCFGLQAQDTLLRIDNVVSFQFDPLGQLLYQDEDGRLYRQDHAADTLYVFDNNLLGDVTYVDASNPFGPLVYFADFDLVLLLDRTLNEVGRLDYRSSNVISSSEAVARNFDNQIWLFDQGDFRLKLLNSSGEISQKSDDLRRLLKIYEPPTQLFINGNKLYAYFPERGIAVFSNFGQFLGWEVEGLSVDKVFFSTKRGIGWRSSNSFSYLDQYGNEQELDLPKWTSQLRLNDLVLPRAKGYWVLCNKKLFYLK